MLSKTCGACGATKPLDDFSRNPSAKHGVNSKCKPCAAEYARRYREKNAESIRRKQRQDYQDRKPQKLAYAARPDVRRRKAARMKAARAASPELSRLKFRAWQYGVSADRLSEMLRAGCAVCGSTDNLHVDHDHKCCPTGKSGPRSCGKCVRGVLCGGCNSSLGHLGEDPARIRRLAEYAERGGATC